MCLSFYIWYTKNQVYNTDKEAVNMVKRFNTAGLCIPSMHYMVNIEDKLEEIEKLIDRRDFFKRKKQMQYTSW